MSGLCFFLRCVWLLLFIKNTCVCDSFYHTHIHCGVSLPVLCDICVFMTHTRLSPSSIFSRCAHSRRVCVSSRDRECVCVCVCVWHPVKHSLKCKWLRIPPPRHHFRGKNRERGKMRRTDEWNRRTYQTSEVDRDAYKCTAESTAGERGMEWRRRRGRKSAW